MTSPIIIYNPIIIGSVVSFLNNCTEKIIKFSTRFGFNYSNLLHPTTLILQQHVNTLNSKNTGCLGTTWNLQ